MKRNRAVKLTPAQQVALQKDGAYPQRAMLTFRGQPWMRVKLAKRTLCKLCGKAVAATLRAYRPVTHAALMRSARVCSPCTFEFEGFAELVPMKIYTMTEVARTLKVSHALVRKWVKEARVPITTRGDEILLTSCKRPPKLAWGAKSPSQRAAWKR